MLSFWQLGFRSINVFVNKHTKHCEKINKDKLFQSSGEADAETNSGPRICQVYNCVWSYVELCLTPPGRARGGSKTTREGSKEEVLLELIHKDQVDVYKTESGIEDKGKSIFCRRTSLCTETSGQRSSEKARQQLECKLCSSNKSNDNNSSRLLSAHHACQALSLALCVDYYHT